MTDLALWDTESLDRDMIDRLYKVARQDALNDPGYLLEMVEAMNKQREYRRIAEDI